MTLVDQVVNGRRYDLDIIYIYADYIKITSCCFFKSVYLVDSIRRRRSNILIVNRDTLVRILLLRFFKSQTNCVPLISRNCYT